MTTVATTTAAAAAAKQEIHLLLQPALVEATVVEEKKNLGTKSFRQQRKFCEGMKSPTIRHEILTPLLFTVFLLRNDTMLYTVLYSKIQNTLSYMEMS